MGLSQTEFAAIGGVGKFAQIRFEKNENMPGGAYLLGLHAAGVDTHYILTGLPGAMTADEAALLVAWRKATAQQRAQVMAELDDGRKAGGQQ